MPLLFLVVQYIIAGGIMWFVAHLMAPAGRDIPLSRAVLAVVLMVVCGAASSHWLKPLIGDWRYLAEFITSALVVMAVFQLSFWSSLLAVLIYWAVIIVAIIIMALVGKSGSRSPDKTGRAYHPAFSFDVC